MRLEDKSKDELINEIKELRQKSNSLKKLINTYNTDRQKAAKMFQDIIDKNPRSIQILDMEGYTIQVNLAHTKLFGIKPPPHYSIFTDNQLITSGFGELFEKIKNGEAVQFPEKYYNAHDVDKTFPDVPLWLTATAFTLNDIYGKAEKIVITHDNITHSKQAEVKLYESKKMLELVMDSIPQFIFWKDRNSVYLGCNENFAHVAGLKSAIEIIGKTDYDLGWKKEESDFYVECDRRVINSGMPEYHIIEQQLQADGKHAWVDTNKVPMFDKSGLVIGVLGTYEDITERKLTEESLKASERLYRKLIENSSLGMHFYTLKRNNQLVFVDANPAASEILGVDNSQFINRTIEEAFPPLKDTEVPVRYREAAEKGTPWTTEQIVYNDGKITGAYEVRAFQTEPGSMVAVFKDITESKRTEVALQESELQFRKLFENAADAIFIAEQENGTIIDANAAAEKLLQMQYSQIIGLNQAELHPLESERYSTDTFRKHQQAVSKSNFTTLVENKVVRSDGTEVPVEILASEVIYKGKKCLMGTFRDITERKKAEFDLLLAKEAAEATNANVTAIIEGTMNNIWAFDRNYNILYINQLFQQEFYQTFGVKLEPGVSLIEALPEPLRPFWKPRYDRALANEQFTIEDAIDTGNGIIYIQVSFNPIVKNGKVIGGSCFGSNITPRRLAELELLKAKELAEESDRLKTAFLQNMSHEIRTPMNAIMGFSGLLVENHGNKPKLEKFSKIINQRCSDLLDIINDILDISKIESGQLSVNIENCNIIELFTELNIFFREYQNRIGKQHINFRLNYPDDRSLSIIQTDKLKLKQILINLISNAFKFTTKGLIECGFKLDNNQIVFHVSDTGIGIPNNKHDTIFERFSQLHHYSLKNVGGTGLGLSIAKGLTGLLGGKIWIESEPEKGTTFHFSINYIKPDLLNRKPLEINDKNDFIFQNQTILIVEDDIYNAEYLEEILYGKGFKILVAEYAERAIQIIENQPVDLILMDIRLPDMTGYEATRIILKSNPNIKIIAQTAYAAHDERQRAIDAGCIDYISKPTKRELLLAIICKYLVSSNI